MDNETFMKMIKRLFCVGPIVMLTILILDSIAFLICNYYPLTININNEIRIIIICILSFVFITVYAWFMIILKKYSMGITLIIKGPYRIVRHPLYSVFSLIIPGIVAFSFNDLWFIFAWILVIVITHFIVRIEEKYLIKKFGDEYIEYKKKVPTLIPYKGVLKI